ncbi:MAG: hypothetical protein ACRC7S_14690 [Cetobacterium sp.]
MRIKDYLEIAKEVERIRREYNLTYEEALEKAKKIYLGEENGSS